MKEWEEKLVAYCEETVADFALLRKAAKQLKDDIFKALHIKQLCKWLESKLTKYKENDVSKKDKLYMESLRHKIRNIEQDKEWTFKAWNRQVNEMLADMKAKDDAIDKLRAEIAKLKAEKAAIWEAYGPIGTKNAANHTTKKADSGFEVDKDVIEGQIEAFVRDNTGRIDVLEDRVVLFMTGKEVYNVRGTVDGEEIEFDLKKPNAITYHGPAANITYLRDNAGMRIKAGKVKQKNI